MRPIPQCAVDFIKREEEPVLRVYDDARPQYILKPDDKPIGTLTAGYGHTGFIFIGDVVTQQKANDWLASDLQEAANDLCKKIGKVSLLLTNEQYGALISFVFNCGTGDPKKPEWKIWKILRAKQFDQVPMQLARFVNGEVGGKTVKIAGLVHRRNAEIKLWSTNEPGSVTWPLSKSIPVRPTVSDPQPAHKSKAIVTSAVAAVAAAPVAYTQAVAAIGNAHASGLHFSIAAVLAALGSVGAGLSALFGYLHKQDAKN